VVHSRLNYLLKHTHVLFSYYITFLEEISIRHYLYAKARAEGGQLGKTYIALASDTISQIMKWQIFLLYVNL
jgi:uncharacterized membrane protein